MESNLEINDLQPPVRLSKLDLFEAGRKGGIVTDIERVAASIADMSDLIYTGEKSVELDFVPLNKFFYFTRVDKIWIGRFILNGNSNKIQLETYRMHTMLFHSSKLVDVKYIGTSPYIMILLTSKLFNQMHILADHNMIVDVSKWS